MKRIVIWGWHWPADIAAIERLTAKGQLKVVEWIGSAPVCTQDLDRFLHQFKMPTATYSGAGGGVYDQVLPYYPEFIDLFSRVGFGAGRSPQELQHIYNIYFDVCSRLLTAERVDAVLFGNIPHFGVDYLLYRIAEALGIEVVMPYQSLVAGRFFAVNHIEDFGIFAETPEDATQSRLTIEKTFKKNLFYMQKITYPKSCCLCSLLSELFHLWFRNRSKPSTFPGIIQKYSQCRDVKQLMTKYARTTVDYRANYVYFPLQLQPELTTSALGGKYADQLLAIEHLASLLPAGWYIYVKENPKQKWRQRDKLFYQRLERIEKAVYVAQNVDTYDLITNARFVATITGTAGWEAISGGKPALVFGKAWYRRLPGVFEYSEKLRLADLLDGDIDPKELESAYNRLMAKTYRGITDPEYKVIAENYSEEENSQQLEAFLVSRLGLSQSKVDADN